ncbi:chlorophyll A-B binding protein [Aureococcus anophagefferens]|nr:chlorophyll A-B binding protein [Aureococcus anophagefferens]
MKLSLALALVAPAAAFQQSSSTAKAASVVAKAGEMPVPEIGLDPFLSMSTVVPSGKFWDEQESLARRRAVEIKHGRIAMTAFIGMMVQELGITFPGSITLDGSVQFSDIGYGFDAIENIPKFGLFQIIEDPTARQRALTCELQNGRAAMLGVTGAMLHSQLDRDHRLLPHHATSRRRSGELGASPAASSMLRASKRDVRRL